MKAKHSEFTGPSWMPLWLKLAAAYNILWGGFVIFFPEVQFELLSMELPRYLGFWQCIGMIVGVYGLGYWWAAKNPYHHWPIVAVGLLGKIFGPIGFLEAIVTGKLPLSFGINIIFNDLLWWPSFFLIMKGAWEYSKERGEWP